MPVILFSEMSKYLRNWSGQIAVGKGPSIWLRLIFNTSNLEHLDKLFGIVVKLFTSSSKEYNSVRYSRERQPIAKLSGMLPDKRLWDRSRCTREAMSPNEEGIAPVKLFLDIVKTLKPGKKVPMSSGMLPEIGVKGYEFGTEPTIRGYFAPCGILVMASKCRDGSWTWEGEEIEYLFVFGYGEFLEGKIEIEAEVLGQCCGASVKTRRRWWGKSSEKGKKEYPPAISWLARIENLSSAHMPWVFRRHYITDGQLVITEEKVERQEYFRVHRSDGRLTL
ncbi:hypothetical protein RJ639_020825 [Escallonia herrerae]|uniref:FAF domain-containing protein n=1 Tax=Escallonia herrerae TaxID=1293975 RepID=A0AA88V681_9ASTE|nr:hypothetical protein RJ639_020825 [Escallonia herrerae]